MNSEFCFPEYPQHLSSDCYSSNLHKCGKTTGRHVNKETLCAMYLSVFGKVYICIVTYM